MTPLDMFSLASGVVAVARHYLPPLRDYCEEERTRGWTPPPSPLIRSDTVRDALLRAELDKAKRALIEASWQPESFYARSQGCSWTDWIPAKAAPPPPFPTGQHE